MTVNNPISTPSFQFENREGLSFEYTPDFQQAPAAWTVQNDAFRLVTLQGQTFFVKRSTQPSARLEMLRGLCGQQMAYLPEVYAVAPVEEQGQQVHYLVQEAMQLQDLETLAFAGRYREIDLPRLAAELLGALRDIHEKGYWHTDFCLKNVFLSEGRCILGDLDSVVPIALKVNAGGARLVDSSVEFLREGMQLAKLCNSPFDPREVDPRLVNYLQAFMMVAKLYYFRQTAQMFRASGPGEVAGWVMGQHPEKMANLLRVLLRQAFDVQNAKVLVRTMLETIGLQIPIVQNQELKAINRQLSQWIQQGVCPDEQELKDIKKQAYDSMRRYAFADDQQAYALLQRNFVHLRNQAQLRYRLKTDQMLQKMVKLLEKEVCIEQTAQWKSFVADVEHYIAEGSMVGYRWFDDEQQRFIALKEKLQQRISVVKPPVQVKLIAQAVHQITPHPAKVKVRNKKFPTPATLCNHLKQLLEQGKVLSSAEKNGYWDHRRNFSGLPQEQKDLWYPQISKLLKQLYKKS